MKKTFSVCGMCGTRCLTEAHVENGEVVWVQGNPHTATGTALCPRGIAAVALEKDPERPRSPLVRSGKRGENLWRKVTWEEALDTVAQKLRAVQAQYGSESVALSHRGGPFTDLYAAFARGLGTPNIYSHGVTCTRNVDRACASVLGLDRSDLVMDYREARHIVLPSRNALEAINLSEVAAIIEAKARGCRLTVMDVRTSVSAARADTFFLMRPGTDYAMNLAVLNVLIGEKLYAPAMPSRIDGFEALTAFVRPYTPQWAEGETGIEAGRIVRLARDLAEAAPRVIWYPGWFTARYADSFATCRTAYLINSLLGSIGERGGMPISLTTEEAGARLTPLAALYPPVRKTAADKAGWQEKGLLHRAFDAAVSGDPYPLRAYISIRHNILSSLPDPDALRRKLDKLELIVAVTTTWSPTAAYADVVLPLSPALSRESILASKRGLKPQFFRRERAAAPRYDTRADWEILCGLAARLGLGKLAFTRIEDIWAYQLHGTGIALKDFDARGFVPLVPGPRWKTLDEAVLDTPSGKIEARSRLWSQAGQDTLPPYTPPVRPREADSFRLIPGRMATHTQSSTTNNPLLSELTPSNVLWMERGRAQALGIADGDMVEVDTPSGTVGRLPAKVTTGIHPEAVFMLHGFGHTLAQESRACGKGVADEACMVGGLDKEDPLGGGLALQEHFVKVRKAEAERVPSERLTTIIKHNENP